MAKRRTPAEEVAFQMEKMKAMGVTISTRRAPGVPDPTPRAVDIITDAARTAGIYEEKSN